MNLQYLKTFCVVLTEGHMTTAANKLSLTQPAVSRQIQSLEQELGIQLLVRSLHKIKPTPQGQVLFDYAKKILNLSQKAEIAVHTMKKKVFHSLKIGTLNSIGMYLMGPILNFFLRHNAHLSVKLVYGSFEKIVDEMKNQQVDFAILPDIKKEPSLDSQHLSGFKERFLFKDEVWLASSHREVLKENNVNLEQFSFKPIVFHLEMYPSFQKRLRDRLNEANLKINPVFEANNVGTLKRVIESGLGWGFLPAHSILKQVRTRRVLHLPCKELSHFVDLTLYYRESDENNGITDFLHKAIVQKAFGD